MVTNLLNSIKFHGVDMKRKTSASKGVIYLSCPFLFNSKVSVSFFYLFYEMPSALFWVNPMKKKMRFIKGYLPTCSDPINVLQNEFIRSNHIVLSKNKNNHLPTQWIHNSNKTPELYTNALCTFNFRSCANWIETLNSRKKVARWTGR